MSEYMKKLMLHDEELNRYGLENWECKDCNVLLDDDGICRSCGFQLEEMRY